MDDSPARSQLTLADKLRQLFDTIRRPEGEQYSDQDVADWITEHWDEFAEPDDNLQRRGVSNTYVGYLRRGLRKQVSASIVVGLARFFGVNPSYLLPGSDNEESIHEQLTMLRNARRLGVNNVQARGSATVSAARLKAIQALLAEASSEIENLTDES